MSSSTVSFGFKAACVGMLVMQNSALALTMRYSRAVLKEQYLTSTTIVLNEVVKLIVAIVMVVVGFRIQRAVPLKELPRHIISIIFCREGVLMLVPGLLYFLMNQLAFIGLENLDASTYSLVSQLKILTTAFFARVLLKKQLAWYQWRALALLVIGVILVQQQPDKAQVVVTQPSGALPALDVPPVSTLPIADVGAPSSSGDASRVRDTRGAGLSGRLLLSSRGAELLSLGESARRDLTYTASATMNLPHRALQPNVARFSLLSVGTGSVPEKSIFQTWKGFIAAAVAAVLSGLAGCYMEKMMKGGTLTVWDRNIQLAVYGILLGLGQIVFLSSDSDRAFAASHGWLGGYSFVACIVVLLNSLGGILVSLVLAYLDNIIRGFATSIAIFITAFVSYTVFHDVVITVVFVCGVLAVIVSVFNYNDTMVAPAIEPSPMPSIASSPSNRSLGTIGSSSSAVELSSVSVHRFADVDKESASRMPRSRSQLINLTPEEDDEKVTLLSRSPNSSPAPR